MRNITTLGFIILFVSFWHISCSQCPIDTTNTTVGFTPAVAAVIQPGIAYSQPVQVFLPTTYSGITIDSIHIDTITNIPSGITYVLNPADGSVAGNGRGAVCFSGTTNAAPGQYVLNYVGFLYSGTATIPLSEVAGQLGYKLRVETMPGAAFVVDSPSCAGVDSVTLTDQTTGYPTRWTWTITGASPGTSHAQNPAFHFDSAGTYNVKLIARNSIGSDTITQSIVVNPSPNGSIVTTPASSNSSPDGSATLVLTGGTPPYAYLWSTTGVNDSISNALPGSYWVLANDAKGCQYLDGNVNVPIASAIQSLTAATLARVYPNPTSDVLNLEWLQKSNAVIAIYDLNGQLIRKWTSNFDARTTCNIHDLASGSYIIRITDKVSNQQQAMFFTVAGGAGQ